MGLLSKLKEQTDKENASRRARADYQGKAKAALKGGLAYPEASPARLFAAVQRAVASLGYGVTHADHPSRTLSFATGASMKSFGGQEMSATITADAAGASTLHFGGRRSQRGLSTTQVVDWGEKADIAARVILRLDEALPDTPEPAAAEAPSAASPGQISGELERLADLHKRGVLDDEEFRAAKTRLLAS
jgi:hypothetical protein